MDGCNTNIDRETFTFLAPRKTQKQLMKMVSNKSINVCSTKIDFDIPPLPVLLLK